VDTALHLPIGQAGDFSHPEALVYVGGEPYGACDRHHQEVLLPERWLDGQEHSLALHGWTGGTQDLRFDGTMPSTAARPPTRLVMGPCALVQIDQPTREFIALARVALGIADHLDGNDPSRAHLYTALDQAFRTLDTRDPLGDRFYASVPAAYDVLVGAIARAGPPLDVQIFAAGHAHIDIAWLWTVDQARRKCERTFHTVLRLMEQFPEFCFSQSQPQLYDYVRQDHPSLFEKIKQRVGEGRWEPLGGMWVEADCNITGGESLVRQFLLGRDFYREHFGTGRDGEASDAPVLWLPDVFGYAWNLPQLIKDAGLEYFFTIKLGWNQTNRLPYDSFWWQGLDGTRVLTHFSPTSPPGSVHSGTFNSDASPGEVLNTWYNFQQKDWGRPGVTPPLLLVFGHGDGGGGPTREMLENIRAMSSFPATPRLRCGTVSEFFRRLEADVGDRLPSWNGELYLEFHRGTYTTHARNKRANRQSEFLLHDAEFLASMATQLTSDHHYPHADLRRAWELTCLNQFHDILPGSSITPVYEESLRQYDEVRDIGERVREEALVALGPLIGGDLLLVNPTSFTRSDLAFWPQERDGDDGEPPTLRRADGTAVAVQKVEGGRLLAAGGLPPYSVTPLFRVDASRDHQPPATSLMATPTLLQNDHLRVELNSDGDITRVFDKVQGREVLCAGAVGNQLQAFEDRPLSPDAWDVDIFYDDRMWLAEPAQSVRVVESGPLRAVLEVRRRILNSEVVQRVSVTHNSPRLDFDTTIDWRERHILLKAAFPVDVLSPQATYEIQWGNVERPTHRNTSWDWARFETCAQKWADLSEGGYGVSLLNDCKYGHDIHDKVIRLSLLRGTIDPDPEADKGEHRFAYSLWPHAGRWNEQTIAQAYALNDPILVWKCHGRGSGAERASAGSTTSFVAVDRPNMVIETVKWAEDGRGLIVRLYESQRCRGDCTVTTGFPLREVCRTNILEEDQERLRVEGRTVRFATRPYQVVTLRLIPL
jgi:alpha-mannosidase